jgi:hypothetical protein
MYRPHSKSVLAQTAQARLLHVAVLLLQWYRLDESQDGTQPSIKTTAVSPWSHNHIRWACGAYLSSVNILARGTVGSCRQLCSTRQHRTRWVCVGTQFEGEQAATQLSCKSCNVLGSVAYCRHFTKISINIASRNYLQLSWSVA